MKGKELGVLMLAPTLMEEGAPAIASLEITKVKGVTGYTSDIVDLAWIRSRLKQVPLPVKELLQSVAFENVDSTYQRLKDSYNKLKPEMPLTDFVAKNIIKHWHKFFLDFAPYYSLFKWYHKKPQPGKNTLLTAPCTFSNIKPDLSFEVIKTDGLLQLDVMIALQNEAYPLSLFTRTGFLLEHKNEYFILGYKAYQMLERLDGIDVAAYAHNADLFAEHVLSLVERDYAVNRNNHFALLSVAVKPDNQLLLSELNNAFIMLTPQWNYDGHLIDGAWQAEVEIKRNGKVIQIQRHQQAEEEFINTLFNLHPNFKNQKNGYYYLSFADAQKKQWFLKAYYQLLQQNIDIIGMDMLKHFRYSPHTPETTLQFKEENGNVLTYEMEVAFGKETIDLMALQRMLIAGQKAVLLKDGALGILGDEWMNTYATLVKHGKVHKKEIQVLRWMAITDKEEQHAFEQHVTGTWWQNWRQWQKSDGSIFEVPQTIQASLRPYQHKGYEWMRLLQDMNAGACLADDMGLGKTLQTITLFAHVLQHNPLGTLLIVCPASLIYNWQQEIEKFLPEASVLIYHGGDRNTETLQENNQVVITTYSTMRRDVDAICAQTYDVAVIDESHNIKNPSSQISQAVMRLSAKFRIALSGTPVINNTFDLYAQLQFAVPGLFGSREFFKKEYADPIDNWQDEEKIAALKRMTAPFILRRTKEQVAKDLPDKTESVLWCEMESTQKEAYNEILEQTRSSIFLEIKKDGFSKSKMSILQGMTRLRQVCSSPALLPEDYGITTKDSVKTTVLLAELNTLLTSHKVLVFSQFSSMLALLSTECKNRSVEHYIIDGKTPVPDRMEMVNAFQQPNNEVNLFLISLKAGNAGLNLTAADYVFLFDPWWNNAVQNQAIDRTHRIGQTKKVFAYKMICKNTIEEKIIKLQQRKQKLSEELIGGDEGFLQSLTEEDVQYLFA